MNIVEKFAATIDVGYEYFEADTWCRLLYFPSPIMPKRTLSKDLYWWIFMDSYEAALDSLTMDLKNLKIKKCSYRGCGFTVIDIHSHNWQFHPDLVKPNMRTTNYMKNTVSEVQGDDIGRLGSNQQEKPDPVGARVTQPAQDESCNGNMNSKLELGQALVTNTRVDTNVETIRAKPREKSEDTGKQELSSNSSKPTNKAHDDEIPREVIGERERNKHDDSKSLGDETCGKTCSR